jgi:hypothetical protein
MARLPLYHQTARSGRGGIPTWWFGAPVVAFLYAFVAGRFVPDLVSVPNDLPSNLAAPLRWFVGIVIGVALLSAWAVVRLMVRRV